MKKKIISIIIIILSFVLMYSSITTNELTIKNAQERVVNEKFEPKEEIVEEETMGEGEEATATEEIDESNSFNSKELATLIISSVVFAISFISVIYSTMVIFNGIQNISSLKVAISYTILVIIFAEVIIISTIIKTDQSFLNGKYFEIEALKREQALYVINKPTEEKNKSLQSTESNETVLKITDEATYTADNLDLTKISGKITDNEDNLKNGVNNVLLATNASQATITNSTITSKNISSSAIYATELNTTLNLYNIEIKTHNDKSKALIAMNKSEINIKNSNIETIGEESELFYSSGTINAENITANTSSSIAKILNTNNLLIKKSTINSKLNKKQNGLFNITSEETTSTYETASLTIEESDITLDEKSFEYKETPLFFVNNTDSQINLTNNNIKYSNNILLKIISSENSGLKNTVFTSSDNTLRGNIFVDKYSKARINFNNTIYTGSINHTNESNNVTVTIDKTSYWNLTGHSYIDTITFQNQNNIRRYINSNGYNIYCNAENNSWLGNRTITLPGGGKLIPINRAS